MSVIKARCAQWGWFSCVATLLSGLLALALTQSPLLGVLGIENAFVLGLVVPLLALFLAFDRVIFAAATKNADATAWLAIAKALGLRALVMGALPLLLLMLNALWVPWCSPGQGLAMALLGPGMGIVLAASLGALVYAYVPQRGWALALVLSLWLGSGLLRLALFWGTPAIFLYDHFWGYFPGALYDRGRLFPLPLLTFRMGTLALVALSWLCLALGWEPSSGRARWSKLWQGRYACLRWTALPLGVYAALSFWGNELGHRHSADYIEACLGQKHVSERCLVIGPESVTPRDMRWLGRDCDVRVKQMEEAMQTRHPQRVRVFLFRDAAHKAELMGASNTYIAKPWRHEVYIQQRHWPHPVLGHEIAHVVAGAFGRGPFRIAGAWGGLVPNPLWIEGIAVAAAWEAVGGMDPHQWARALMELDSLPALNDLLGLRFMTQASRQAYTVAGSLIRYLRKVHGAAAVQRLYRGDALKRITGRSLSQFEKAWHAFLRQQVRIPPKALAQARRRFAQRSVFRSPCPHRSALMLDAIAEAHRAGRWSLMGSRCQALLSTDPAMHAARLRYIDALVRQGKMQRASEWAHAFKRWKMLAYDEQAKELRADALWRRGQGREAAQLYGGILERDRIDDATFRRIELKHLAVHAAPAQQQHLRPLLMYLSPHANRPFRMAYHLNALAEHRHDGLAFYLHAKHVFAEQQYAQADVLLTKAHEKGLPTRALKAEALRLQAIAAVALGDKKRAKALWWQLSRDYADMVHSAEVGDWLARLQLS